MNFILNRWRLCCLSCAHIGPCMMFGNPRLRSVRATANQNEAGKLAVYRAEGKLDRFTIQVANEHSWEIEATTETKKRLYMVKKSQLRY